ncbi:acetoacetate--CoA ligase [Paeniglutamicibacter sp. ZC-3]|uniref:acetoacetate--CoA ligase n=1 Tax=Paeniglutamicibacter sp. ZC-3 TaxID=2986919 RepID=UPI0021F70CA4|nr:acetoacetate--CoA ligase [Paeniglutamicibacter sp. ZC-3]MCV9993482.1 acetoacetate--CoA ligase [Paeniglutamicibacter sp. ZC-3]
MITDAQAADGEVIWQPEPEDAAQTGVGRFAAFLGGQGIDPGTGYDELWAWSVAEPERFWELFARFAGVEFGGTEGPVCTTDAMPHTRWFPGRTLNFARHLLQGHEGIALIGIAEDGTREEVTFEALRHQVASLAAHLRARGVGHGDRVVAILPNVAEAVVGLLAAASIGAVWSVCAPEFGPGAIVSRFAQLDPKVVIAAPGYMLGGKDRDRRTELEEIFAQLPTVEHVIWVGRHTSIPSIPITAPAVDWAQAVAEPAELHFDDVEFSHPLWVLFSSGTTGIPKGIVHGHGGALLEEMKMLLIHSDLRQGDRYLNVASTSWVLWNAVVSALGVGATAVLVDGNPTFPSIDRVWQIAAAERVAVLGVGAGFVHSCAKAAMVPMRDHDLGDLKSLQVTGSPLSADGYRWVYGNVGDIWLASMSGGTDIASIFVGGSPTLPVHVGHIQAPALGVRVESWDEAGNPTRGKGELVVTKPMPSMPLSFWGDDGSRYHESYFSMYPGVWRHGDFIEFTHRGILIHGRSDSTLNRNGLRLGSADIYAVVESLPEVAEALVVGAELGTDYYMPLFVHVAEGVNPEAAREAITRAIRENLSVRYLPDEIVFMRGIPHTRTGKKLEVPVKRLLQGAQLDTVADLGSVDDPQLLEAYADFALGRQSVSP